MVRAYFKRGGSRNCICVPGREKNICDSRVRHRPPYLIKALDGAGERADSAAVYWSGLRDAKTRDWCGTRIAIGIGTGYQGCLVYVESNGKK